MAEERVQKILASAGIGSRRVCEALIEEGRVAVNGQAARLGMKADAEVDEISVDGAKVPVNTKLRYILLNKPAGYLSTVSDPEGRPTVMDLIPTEERVFPVGRLDMATEGLLILTNDGELANRLSHPSGGVEKTYVVEVAGRIGASGLKRLRTGVALEDGVTAPARISVLGRSPGRQLLQVTIHEGRNRQIRRMIDAVGGRVTHLARTGIGRLSDRSLKPGRWRVLGPHEVSELYAVNVRGRRRSEP